MRTLEDIKDEMEALKDTFDDDTFTALEECLEEFNRGNFYSFLDKLDHLTTCMFVGSNQDYQILKKWNDFSKEFINDGFVNNCKGEFIPFQTLRDHNIVDVYEESLDEFIEYNIPESLEDSINGTLYFPRDINCINDEAFNDCSIFQKMVLHRGFFSIGRKAFNNSNLEEFICLSDIEAIESEVFSNCNRLKSVKFNHYVTEIGDSAFYKCTQLKEVDFGDDIKEIEADAFANCINLETFNFGERLRDIGDRGFLNTKLKEINLPSSARDVGYRAFAGVNEETVITAPCLCDFEEGNDLEIKRFIPEGSRSSSCDTCRKNPKNRALGF